MRTGPRAVFMFNLLTRKRPNCNAQCLFPVSTPCGTINSVFEQRCEPRQHGSGVVHESRPNQRVVIQLHKPYRMSRVPAKYRTAMNTPVRRSARHGLVRAAQIKQLDNERCAGLTSIFCLGSLPIVLASVFHQPPQRALSGAAIMAGDVANRPVVWSEHARPRLTQHHERRSYTHKSVAYLDLFDLLLAQNVLHPLTQSAGLRPRQSSAARRGLNTQLLHIHTGSELDNTRNVSQTYLCHFGSGNRKLLVVEQRLHHQLVDRMQPQQHLVFLMALNLK